MSPQPFIGIGLRRPHYQDILEQKPKVDWFEVHSENYLIDGGVALAMLSSVRKDYPISMHGVGLSLGSAQGIENLHLARLKKLADNLDPFLISEHLSWNYVDNVYLPDLVPVPYTDEAMQTFCNNIEQTQNFLKRQILIENPSSYIEYVASNYSESEFLAKIASKSGAGILLDVNNIYVSCVNHGWDARAYINAIPKNFVKEIHLAGHSVKTIKDQKLLIDTHDNFVCQEVWELYALAIQRFGNVPTLLEWDANIPELAVLVNEALKAREFCKILESENVDA
jgi:uncharacterized protein (UPF0276 family)